MNTDIYTYNELMNVKGDELGNTDTSQFHTIIVNLEEDRKIYYSTKRESIIKFIETNPQINHISIVFRGGEGERRSEVK